MWLFRQVLYLASASPTASPSSCTETCHPHPHHCLNVQKGISLPSDQWDKLLGGMDELQAAVDAA